MAYAYSENIAQPVHPCNDVRTDYTHIIGGVKTKRISDNPERTV